MARCLLRWLSWLRAEHGGHVRLEGRCRDQPQLHRTDRWNRRTSQELWLIAPKGQAHRKLSVPRRINMRSKIAAVLVYSLIARAAFAADTDCGGAPCKEAICSSPDVIQCSDFDNDSFDGWTVTTSNSHLYRNGG